MAEYRPYRTDLDANLANRRVITFLFVIFETLMRMKAAAKLPVSPEF